MNNMVFLNYLIASCSMHVLKSDHGIVVEYHNLDIDVV